MTDLETTKPLYESSVKLCAAVKKYKILHDQDSYKKTAPLECIEAWEMVAEECNETIDFCRNRWKSLRRCFFDGLKRKGTKYYLHDHLKFLLKSGKDKNKRNSLGSYYDETNSSISDNHSLRERKAKAIAKYDDEDDDNSKTTSADESNEVPPAEGGVFIINELEDDDNYEPSDDPEDDMRHSFSRSCKRALDPHLIDELADDEEPQEKRSRRSEKSNANKPIKIKLNKILKSSAHKLDQKKGKAVDRSTFTEPHLGKDVATQYDLNAPDFDDIFMQTINTQLQAMNGRQKMNFKRKIYQSLLEVFDDANDFPNGNETPSSPHKPPTNVVNTTLGELRLMRELVSLVQAAKVTPEIMNANEKIKAPTAGTSKPAAPMQPPIVDNRPRNSKSPLTLSPTPEDEDLHFFIGDSDDEEVPLPRTWDEIKAKTAEITKTSIPENALGLPRRILQKVVRVSGANGGTIVARDGDKKRIYRIVPKLVNQSGNISTQNKNDANISRIIVSSAKPPQDNRKESSVGTFYVPNTKNPLDLPKPTYTTSNFTIRTFNGKSLNSSQQATLLQNNQSTSSNINLNNTNGQTVFKNVHPANRILSSTTGYFKTVPLTQATTPPPIQKTSSQSTTTTTTMVTSNPTVSSKVMTTKLPSSPMLPPASNTSNKRVQALRSEPQIVQRRFSICGPVPPDQRQVTPSPKLRSTISPNNGSAQSQSSMSRIQISQPVSLNAKAINATANLSSQITSTMNKPNTPTPPPAVKPIDTANAQAIKLPVKKVDLTKEAVNSPEPANNSMLVVQREIPVLETAGTVEADDLDPLFVKTPHVKSEPIELD